MQQQIAGLQTLLDVPYIRRVRRNHGLEHATIHLLARRVSHLKIAGRSDGGGFWLFGEVETDQVENCVRHALERMQGGEHKLAIHPNCGTNLVTVAALGAVATLVALIGSDQEKFGKIVRLPLVMLGLMAAMLIGQPLGLQLQEHVTTLGDPGDLVVVSIQRVNDRGMMMHRVKTVSS
jgi:hypothetical protein